MDDPAHTRTAGTTGAAGGGIRSRRSVAVLLALALLSGARAGPVMLPKARHLRSRHDDVRAHATLRTSGACVLGRCEVEFEADGRTVVAGLPAGSSGGKSPAGTRLTVRYRADDPRMVARESDVDGGAAAVETAAAAVATLTFLTLAALVALSRAWHRGSAPARTTGPDRTRQDPTGALACDHDW
ncbi:hypothetical protein [Streptomyces sp. NPDC058612]|uniref:hypothetical protein n=1 Tax=Streptomyces sp. NPDC058612 TaxID=3346555 RepID=UPI00364B86E4